MKIAFVCVNYNNAKVTIKYIMNVIEIKKNFDLKIIIIDNASGETDILELDKFILDLNMDDVFLIKSLENLGYFKGLNIGINFLDKVKYDYVVIGNNDLEFQLDFLETLELKKYENSVLVVSPNIIRMDGVHQNPHMINKFTAIQKVYRSVYFTNYRLAVCVQFLYGLWKRLTKSDERKGGMKRQEIAMGYGACYILTKRFFDFFKVLDAPNFLMGEEGVLANQVLSVKGITIYDPDLIVNHLDHTSIGKLPSRKLFDYNQVAYYHFIRECKYLR